MAGFIESVTTSFLERSPTEADRRASAEVDVEIGRKLLESLLQVGLGEALGETMTLRGLELASLCTVHSRRAQIEAHVAGTKICDFDVTLSATVELREPIGDGLKLVFHALEATGRGGPIDWFFSRAIRSACNALVGKEVTIDSVKLRGASVRKLEISGQDPVRIVVELKNADLGEIF
jgi:hypothetical protein